MVIDQACFVPVFFAALLPILSFSQGIPPHGIPQKLKQVDYYFTLCLFNVYITKYHQDYPSVLWANYKVKVTSKNTELKSAFSYSYGQLFNSSISHSFHST